MTLEELTKALAEAESITVKQAHSIVRFVFGKIREQALAGHRVGIPEFGSFNRRVRKAAKRRVAGVEREVLAAVCLTFRPSIHAKRAQ